MKFINRLYSSIKESNFKLLLFAFGMIVLMFSQNYIAEPIEEIESESSLIEDVENEKEGETSSDNELEDVFVSRGFNDELTVFLSSRELFFQNAKYAQYAGFPLEVPFPPPEDLI